MTQIKIICGIFLSLSSIIPLTTASYQFPLYLNDRRMYNSFTQHIDRDVYDYATIRIRYCDVFRRLVVGNSCDDAFVFTLVELIQRISTFERTTPRNEVLLLIFDYEACENLNSVIWIQLKKIASTAGKNLRIGFRVVKGIIDSVKVLTPWLPTEYLKLQVLGQKILLLRIPSASKRRWANNFERISNLKSQLSIFISVAIFCCYVWWIALPPGQGNVLYQVDVGGHNIVICST